MRCTCNRIAIVGVELRSNTGHSIKMQRAYGLPPAIHFLRAPRSAIILLRNVHSSTHTETLLDFIYIIFLRPLFYSRTNLRSLASLALHFPSYFLIFGWDIPTHKPRYKNVGFITVCDYFVFIIQFAFYICKLVHRETI